MHSLLHGTSSVSSEHCGEGPGTLARSSSINPINPINRLIIINGQPARVARADWSVYTKQDT